MITQNINSIINSYPHNILREFDYSEEVTKALTTINQELNELFNFIEPGFFEKKIIVIKNFKDEYNFPVDQAVRLNMNKAKLFDYGEDIVIQLFSDGNIMMWEKVEYSELLKSPNNISYIYENNRERFIVKNKQIDITINDFGSRFSNEFDDLEKQLYNYYLHKIKDSSCPLFQRSWATDERIFFIGGGKDIPEKYMQESLHNFIKDLSIFKGELGQFDPTREHNLDGSKPVDIIVRWEKSNRIALIEIKWLGKSVYEKEFKSKYSNARANYGYKQLNNYFQLAKKDNPNKLIRCYLVVIDGRRKNANNPDTNNIAYDDGMSFAKKEIELIPERQYFLRYKNIVPPLRMFAEPKSS